MHRLHLLSLLGLIAFALSLPTACLADETKDQLEDAKRRRLDILENAEKSLLKAFDEAIVNAAKDKDVESVQALVTEKEAFQKDFTKPTSSQVAVAFERYVTTRKSAAGELHTAYQRAITTYAGNLLLAESKAVGQEAKDFTTAEKAVLDKLLNSRTAKSTETITKIRSTKEWLDEFFNRYEKAIEVVDVQETDARFREALKDVPDKLDGFLKPLNWTFHCEITEIQEERNGRTGLYTISFDVPDEVAEIPNGWQCRGSVKMRLKKDEALAVEPGQVLVVTGSPRFSRNGNSDYMFLKCQFQRFERSIFEFHSIELTRIRTEIRKTKPQSVVEK